MLLALFLATSSPSFGLGLYGEIIPGGVGLSLRYFPSPSVAMQLVIGGFAAGEHGGRILLGGRIPFGISQGGDRCRFVHFLGPAIWLGFWSYGKYSGMGLGLQGFYEFEVWPSPSVPISFGLGAGLNILPRISFFIPFNFHFYF